MNAAQRLLESTGGTDCEPIMTVFDQLLSCVQVEEIPGTDDVEEAKQALLASLNPGKYVSPFRLTTPVYEPPDPDSEHEKSAPFPFEYKADVNKRQGVIVSYLAVWLDPATGQPFIDGYKDRIFSTAFDATVKELEQARRYKNSDYLLPDLWQHDRKEQIGGIKALYPDSRGVIYEAQLLTSVARARQVLDLAAAHMIGSSYGYTPVLFDYTGDIRNLKAVALHEVSQVSSPANPYTSILDVKSRFYVPSNYPGGKQPVQRTNWQAVRTDLKKSDELFHQLVSQGIAAYQQYKREHR